MDPTFKIYYCFCTCCLCLKWLGADGDLDIHAVVPSNHKVRQMAPQEPSVGPCLICLASVWMFHGTSREFLKYMPVEGSTATGQTDNSCCGLTSAVYSWCYSGQIYRWGLLVCCKLVIVCLTMSMADGLRSCVKGQCCATPSVTVSGCLVSYSYMWASAACAWLWWLHAVEAKSQEGWTLLSL